jgi:hypothetical protein
VSISHDFLSQELQVIHGIVVTGNGKRPARSGRKFLTGRLTGQSNIFSIFAKGEQTDFKRAKSLEITRNHPKSREII